MAELIAKRLGTSGKTAMDLLEHIDHHRLPIIGVENVEGFSSDTHGQLTVFLDALAEMGYLAKSFSMSASDFYLPTDRKRLYVVAMHEDKVKFPDGTSILEALDAMGIILKRLSSDEVLFNRRLLI